jgi:lysophospholipase L1-like esterase
MKLSAISRIFAVLALFLSASCGGSGGPTGPLFDLTDKVIVAFGNSITAGVGDSSYPGSAAGYPFRLEQLLKSSSPDVIVLNRGVPGEETNDGERRLSAVLERDDPDYVLILEGVNNIQDSGLSEAGRIANDLEAMVVEVKEYGAIPLIASLLPTKGQWAWRNEVIEVLNPMIETIALRQQITFVDQHAAFMNEPDYEALLTSDGVHPNDEGYAVMAETWYEGMLATL